MKDLNNLDVVFTTPNKKNNRKDVKTSEFNNNNPLLKAPKKNKVKKLFKNIHTSNNHQ